MVTTTLFLLSLTAMDRAGWRAHACQLLSPEEEEAYARIRVDRRRAEYAFGRMVVRGLAASRWRIHPENVQIRSDIYGKPRLCPPSEAEPTAFNLSHSGDLLAIALSDEGEVGVDVELLPQAPQPDLEAIAERHFSEAERHAISQSPSEQRLETFFRMWTLKESMLKAIGRGLSIPLKTVNVAERKRIYRTRLVHDIETWSLEAFHWPDLRPGYHIALAAQGSLGSIRIADIPVDLPMDPWDGVGWDEWINGQRPDSR